MRRLGPLLAALAALATIAVVAPPPAAATIPPWTPDSSVTNLAAVQLGLETYDAEVVRGTELTAEQLDGLIELFRTRSAEERREIVGLQRKRAEVIVAGACVVRTVLAKLGSDALTVSDRGLRHRLLVERFGA